MASSQFSPFNSSRIEWPKNFPIDQVQYLKMQNAKLAQRIEQFESASPIQSSAKRRRLDQTLPVDFLPSLNSGQKAQHKGADVEQFEYEIQVKNKMIENYTKRVKAAEEVNNEQRQVIMNLSNQNAQMQADLEKSQATCAQIKREKNMLKQKLQKQVELNGILEDNIEVGIRKATNLGTEKALLEAKLIAEKDSSRKLVLKLKHSIEGMEISKRTLEERIQKEKEKNSALEGRLSEMENSIAAMQSSKMALEQQVQKEKEKNSVLEEKLLGCVQEKQKAEQDLAKWKQNYNRLHDAYASQDNPLQARFFREMAAVQAKHRDEMAQKEQLHTNLLLQYTEQANRLTGLEQQVKFQRKKFDALKEHKHALETEVSRMNADLHDQVERTKIKERWDGQNEKDRLQRRIVVQDGKLRLNERKLKRMSEENRCLNRMILKGMEKLKPTEPVLKDGKTQGLLATIKILQAQLLDAENALFKKEQQERVGER